MNPEYSLLLQRTLSDPLLPFLLGIFLPFCLFAFLFTCEYLTASPVVLHHHRDISVSVRVRSQETTDHTRSVPLLKYLQANCPSLFGSEGGGRRAVFRPTPWLWNGHLQTLKAVKHTETFEVQYEREILTTLDGGSIALDWSPLISVKPFDDTPTLVMTHGLTGGSHESYVQDVAERMLRKGYRVVVVNFRGCADSDLTSPMLYSAGYTDDLRLAISHIRRCIPRAKLAGTGFSLGANVLVKYVGEEGKNCPLSCAVSVANPFDLLASSRHMARGFLGNKFYTKVLAQNLTKAFSRHRRQFENSVIDLELVKQARSVREFDIAVTKVLFGYKTVNEYYQDASSWRFIPHVRIPLLCLNALDDYIAVAEAIPFDECVINPYVLLATTSKGGHLGWMTGWTSPKRWSTGPIVEYVCAMFEADPDPIHPSEHELPEKGSTSKASSVNPICQNFEKTREQEVASSNPKTTLQNPNTSISPAFEVPKRPNSFLVR